MGLSSSNTDKLHNFNDTKCLVSFNSNQTKGNLSQKDDNKCVSRSIETVTFEGAVRILTIDTISS